MDADSPQDPPLPGYSIPIRAPLTIDSDSEFYLPAKGYIYSRTSSFNSSTSSIDISSYGDEHTSIFEEYPDEEIVIKRSHLEESCFSRPFVRYPDENNVKESCEFSESKFTVFRPFVKYECEESSSVDVGAKFSMPVARLTGDSDRDGDSDEGDDGVVRKFSMDLKVRSFNGDEGDDELLAEGVFSGDDMIGIENLNFVSTDSVENEGCKVGCLDEVVKLSKSCASSFDLERIDALTVSSSNDEIEVERKIYEADENEMSFGLERTGVHTVSSSDIEIENLSSVLTESIEYERCKVECLNTGKKLSELDATRLHLERKEPQTASSSNDETEIEGKHSEADELSFDSERVVAHIYQSSDSESGNSSSGSTISVKTEGCKVDCLTEIVKLSQSDASSPHLERIEPLTTSSLKNEIEIETIKVKHTEPDEHNVSSSNSETDFKTINESEEVVVSKSEEEPLKKMQRVRTKFLRLAFNEQLTMKANGLTGNYNFDFALTILAIGKTGVGKSATINSIFGENKAVTNTFNPGTTTIQEITGNVDGIQLRIIDTPGLKCSFSDQSYNLKVLNSIKRFTRKHTPNVVLYVDRLDTHDVDDSHLLKLITSSLGSSLWHRCIIALTHAGCDASDELLDRFMVQRCRFLQEQIVSLGGNNRHVANPVWLVDNHPSYKHVMGLGYDLKGLVCLDQADEDVGCNEVRLFEPLIINRSGVRRDECYIKNGGSVNVKFVYGTKGWFFGFG